MFMQRRHDLFVSLPFLCLFAWSITNVITWNMLKTTKITNQQLSSFFWQAVVCYFIFSAKCMCLELVLKKNHYCFSGSAKKQKCVQLSRGYCYFSYSFTNVSKNPFFTALLKTCLSKLWFRFQSYSKSKLNAGRKVQPQVFHCSWRTDFVFIKRLLMYTWERVQHFHRPQEHNKNYKGGRTPCVLERWQPFPLVWQPFLERGYVLLSRLQHPSLQWLWS